MSTNQIPVNEHSIPLDRAIEMTKRYRENREKILSEEFKGKGILPLSETFNKDAFNSFFANPACKAIRIYYGMSEDLNIHAIIVGVNDRNEDLLPAETLLDDVADEEILEDSLRCPPACPPSSPLNTP